MSERLRHSPEQAGICRSSLTVVAGDQGMGSGIAYILRIDGHDAVEGANGEGARRWPVRLSQPAAIAPHLKLLSGIGGLAFAASSRKLRLATGILFIIGDRKCAGRILNEAALAKPFFADQPSKRVTAPVVCRRSRSSPCRHTPDKGPTMATESFGTDGRHRTGNCL